MLATYPLGVKLAEVVETPPPAANQCLAKTTAAPHSHKPYNSLEGALGQAG